MDKMREFDENEQKIFESVKSSSGKFMNYNPGALKLLRPTLSINKLIGETNHTSAFAKTSSIGSFKMGLPNGKSSYEKALIIKKRLQRKKLDNYE